MAATSRSLKSLLRSRHYRITHGLVPEPIRQKPTPEGRALAQHLLKHYTLPEVSEDDDNHEKGP